MAGKEKTIVTILRLDSKGFNSKLGKTRKSILKVSGAITGLAAGMLALTKVAANYQDDMIKSARATGTTVEEFSALSHAASLAGASFKALRSATIKLGNPTKDNLKTLKAIGVELKDSNGKMKSNTRLLGEIGDAMNKLESPQKKLALATKLFGEQGANMVSMLELGTEGLKEMGIEAEKMGIIVSEKAGLSAEKFNDNIAKIAGSLKGLNNVIGESVIEFINQSEVIEKINETIQSVTQWWRKLDDDTRGLIVTVSLIAAGIAAFVLVLTGLIAIAPAVGVAMSLMLGPVGLVITGIATATIAVIALSDSFEENIREGSKMLGPIGLIITGIVDATIAVIALSDSLEDNVREGRKETQTIIKLRKQYVKLAGRANLTAAENRRLGETNKALGISALNLGVALSHENGQLKTMSELISEINAKKRMKIAQDLAEIGQKIQDVREQIEGGTESFFGYESSLLSVQKGFGLMPKTMSQAKKELKDLQKLSFDLVVDMGNLNETAIKTSKTKLFRVDLSKIKSTTGAVKDFSDYLQSEFTISLLKARDEYDKFVKAVQAEPKMPKDFAKRLIKDAKKIRIEAEREIANKELEIVRNFLGENSRLREISINNNKGKALKAIDELLKHELISDKRLLKQRLISDKEYQKQRLISNKEYQKQKEKIEGKATKELLNSQIESFKEYVNEITAFASKITGPLSAFAEADAEGFRIEQDKIERDFEIRLGKFEKASENEKNILLESEDQRLAELRNKFDEQIAQLTAHEKNKTGIIERSAAERLLVLDTEYQKAKELEEIKFQNFLESERRRFDAEKEIILEKAVNKEQRNLTDSIMEEDFKNHLENLNNAHEMRVTEMAKSFQAQRKADNDKSAKDKSSTALTLAQQIKEIETERNAALLIAEAEKNKNIENLDAQHNAQTSLMEKERLGKLWEAQKAEFNATKSVKIAETITSGIASAASAFAALAPIIGIGFGLGIAAAALIGAATVKSVSNIQAQEPKKPVGLILEKGGVIGGTTRHASGGIQAEIESGETLIDRDKTQKIIDFVDRGTTKNNSIIIEFQAGSIVSGDSIIDESMIDIFAQKLGDRVEGALAV